ncbi:GLD2 polymerase, partial [Geococcyx californianus]|nr:GLD2 polymerase [Geococcyx californianus]
MFPYLSNMGHPPFPPKHQQHRNFFHKSPLNIPPTYLFHQQVIDPQFSFQNATGNLAAIPAVKLQTVTHGYGSPVATYDASTSFCGRKRTREQRVPRDVKRQRFHSQHSETTVVNQAVPLPEERRYSFPGSSQSPLPPVHCTADRTRCVPPLQHTLFPDPIKTTLPVAEDKLSQQVLELFQECQQQTCDLDRKELCRTELQREIQQIFPQISTFFFNTVFQVNQKTEARHILSLVQKLFSTKLSNYIERPHLIQAKVPIVKFRDKVRQVFCVEFDLNVNNVVGIRNTFLLRTYAYIENRVRPLVLVVKKWANFHGINDASRGTLSSYSLVLMVLHYLQS